MKRLFLAVAMLALSFSAGYAQNTYGGGVSGSVTVNCVPKSDASNSFATTVICSDGTTTTINGSKFSVTEASGNTIIAGTLGVTGNVAIATNKFTVTASNGNTLVAGTLNSTGDFAVATNKFTVASSSGNTVVAGTLGVTSDVAVNTNKFNVTASSGNTTVAGTLVVTGSMNGPFGATVDLTTPIALTAAQSGQIHISASTADAVQVYTLPLASVAGGRHCFSLGSSSLGSNREIDVEPQGASDLIIGTTTPAGSAGIVSTAGPAHGIKNTHATAVRGNAVCLQSDGVNTWYMTSLIGVWGSY